MHKDFHLYGTFLAAILAGYSVDESEQIAFAAQKVDEFGRDRSDRYYTVTNMFSDTAQAARELYMSRNCEKAADLSHTWMLHHFMPRHPLDMREKITDLSKTLACGDGVPMQRICDGLAAEKDAVSPERLGLTMHVLADCYAHKRFCGVTCCQPRIIKDICLKYGDCLSGLDAGHVPVLLSGVLSGIFYFGHGAAGHVPDLSWARYSYQWKDGRQVREHFRDNADVFAKGFCRMVQVLSNCRKSPIPETMPGFSQRDMSVWLEKQADQEARERCNILWRNQAIIQVKSQVGDSLSEKWISGEPLTQQERMILEELKHDQFPVPYRQEDGTMTEKWEKGEVLLAECCVSPSQGEESDTVCRDFYQQHLQAKWKTPEELGDAYDQYQKDTQKDQEFIEAVKAHQEAAYQALGFDRAWLSAQIEHEFSAVAAPWSDWISWLWRSTQ